MRQWWQLGLAFVAGVVLTALIVFLVPDLRSEHRTCVLASAQTNEARAIVERCMADLTSGEWRVTAVHDGGLSVWELERPRVRLP